MYTEIKSSHNPTIKHILKLKQKKYRDEYSEFMAEGIKAVSEAVNSDFEISCIVVSEGFSCNFDSFIKVPDSLFASLCETKSPQGILAVVRQKKEVPDFNKDFYIYCDCIQDPGNLGTIIRSADAFGFGGVLLSPDCADLYSGKVIRSSMGSVFHINITQDCNIDMLENFKKKGYRLAGTALKNESVTLYELKPEKKTVFIVGNEGSGIREEILNICDKTVLIPMSGNAESLNVGVASALIMSEVQRKCR